MFFQNTDEPVDVNREWLLLIYVLWWKSRLGMKTQRSILLLVESVARLLAKSGYALKYEFKNSMTKNVV